MERDNRYRDAALNGYTECALWSSTDDDGVPLDRDPGFIESLEWWDTYHQIRELPETPKGEKRHA